MPIDVGLGFGYEEYVHRFIFGPDVYQATLHEPFKRLEEKTGLYVDIYGAVFFKYEELKFLEKLVYDAASYIKSKPSEWEVYMGRTTYYKDGQKLKEEETFETAYKEKLTDLVANLTKVVEEAKANKKGISFLGD